MPWEYDQTLEEMSRDELIILATRLRQEIDHFKELNNHLEPWINTLEP